MNKRIEEEKKISREEQKKRRIEQETKRRIEEASVRVKVRLKGYEAIKEKKGR